MGSALAVRDVPVLLALGGLADLDVGAALGREILGTRDDGLTTGVEDGLVTSGRDVVVVQRGLVEDPGELTQALGTGAGTDELDRVVPVLTDLLGAGGALGVAGALGQVTLQLGPALGEVVLDALVVDAHFARRDERSVDVVHLGTVGGDGLVGVHDVLLGSVVLGVEGSPLAVEHGVELLHAEELVHGAPVLEADVTMTAHSSDGLVQRRDGLEREVHSHLTEEGARRVHVDLRVDLDLVGDQETIHCLHDALDDAVAGILTEELGLDVDDAAHVVLPHLLDGHGLVLGALLAAPVLVVPLLHGELAEADLAHDGVVRADVTQVLLAAAQTEGDDGLVHAVLLDVVDLDVELVGDAVRQVQSLALAEHAVVLGAQVDDVLRPGEASGDLHVRLGQGIQSVGHVPTDVGQAVVLTRDGLLVRAGADVLFHG